MPPVETAAPMWWGFPGWGIGTPDQAGFPVPCLRRSSFTFRTGWEPVLSGLAWPGKRFSGGWPLPTTGQGPKANGRLP
jgi:hypothetical protein